jgi:hypothetical protein
MQHGGVVAAPIVKGQREEGLGAIEVPEGRVIEKQNGFEGANPHESTQFLGCWQR